MHPCPLGRHFDKTDWNDNLEYVIKIANGYFD